MKKIGLALLITTVFFVVVYLLIGLTIWIAYTFGPGWVMVLGLFVLVFYVIYTVVLDE